jgi:hypothetical protein
MTARIKHSVNRFGLAFLVLIAAFICGCGCVAPQPSPDPLAGWRPVFVGQPDKTIEKDYQDYIQKLPPDDRKYAGPIWFFENGTGQHAIKIDVEYGGSMWEHVLIYDKDEKRVKLIKYYNGRYMS